MINGEFASNSPEITPEDRKRADSLYRMVSNTALDKRVIDQVEQQMLEALRPELKKDGLLRPLVEEVYSFKRQIGAYYPPGLDLRTLEFALNKQLLRYHPKRYPYFATGTHFWKSQNVFEPMVQESSEEIFHDMLENLRSTVIDTKQIDKIISELLIDRWTSPPTVVDIGTGLGLGLIKWKRHKYFPYKSMGVLTAPNRNQPVSPDLPPDEESQTIIDFLVNQEPKIGKVVGYDIMPINPNDSDMLDLVFSSTFPMRQSIDDVRGVTEFHELTQAAQVLESSARTVSQSGPKEAIDIELPRRNIDATDPESLEQLADFLPDGKADIFTFSGVILQLPPEKLGALIDNFRSYCNEGALFLVSEWANLNPTSSLGLEVIREDWWHKGEYKTFIIDPFKSDQPPIEFCRFLSRQCKQMYLSPAGRDLLHSRFS